HGSHESHSVLPGFVRTTRKAPQNWGLNSTALCRSRCERIGNFHGLPPFSSTGASAETLEPSDSPAEVVVADASPRLLRITTDEPKYALLMMLRACPSSSTTRKRAW